jgi:hypothetical protein
LIGHVRRRYLSDLANSAVRSMTAADQTPFPRRRPGSPRFCGAHARPRCARPDLMRSTDHRRRLCFSPSHGRLSALVIPRRAPLGLGCPPAGVPPPPAAGWSSRCARPGGRPIGQRRYCPSSGANPSRRSSLVSPVR